MTDVAILVYDDCQASAISMLSECLSVANLHWSLDAENDPLPFTWRTISWRGGPVRALGGLVLAADGSVDDLGTPDLIFAPAIPSDDGATMVAAIRDLHGRWCEILRTHHLNGVRLAANCSATFLLAETGLLDGRRATTSWWLARRFRERYPRIDLQPYKLVTRDSGLICAAAFSACLNLGLEVVAEFLGPRAALSCARVMLVDVNRATQLPYANLETQVKHGDELVMRAQTLLLSHLTDTIKVAELAARLGITSRTLSRRFKAAIGESPLEFLQNARIERAKRLLETTSTSFDGIAYRVGYADASSFRRLFSRTVGVSPGEYRRRFGPISET